MCPPLTPEQAARLYDAMLTDVIEASLCWAPELGLVPYLAVHPPDAVDELAGRAPAPFRVVAQRGADLGERMEAAVVAAAEAGHAPVLLRGSDSPALGREVLRAALAALGRADLVICPDRDGGYNLVGVRRPAPGLFAHPMSTSSVLADTLANAGALGLTSEVLAAGFDVDTAEDLHWLAEARRAGAELPCPRTLALLDREDLWRFAHRSAK